MITTIFAITHIVQFGLLIQMLTPPYCMYSCVISAVAGMAIIPTFFGMYYFLKKRQIFGVILIGIFPMFFSFTVKLVFYHCYDPQWYFWFVQGLTVPAIFWTIYQLLIRI